MEAVFNILALLFGISALFGYLNHRYLRLPNTVGMVVIALTASLVVLVVDGLAPAWGLKAMASGLLQEIDFTETLMKGVLGFLLFAGALHVDMAGLMERRWAITLMATLGVLLSTLIIGVAMWWIFGALDLPVPLLACLVLGAVISPTDPVAVLGILKRVRVPPTLEAKFAGESLFNDGVGVVVFTILVAIAFGGHGEITALGVVGLFLSEAVGGALLGLAFGYIVFLAMRSIDEHNVEILMTLALVTITYGVANLLHVSGLIAVVVAGLLIGNRGTRLAMSATTREHLTNFWMLMDEILNSLLFLLIGFEVLAVSGKTGIILAAAAAVPVALVARLVAVAVPLNLLRLRRTFTPGAVWVLTWGGLRGGISVALVLSLPETPVKELLLTVCYAVVIFSVIVQGLSIEALVRRVVPRG